MLLNNTLFDVDTLLRELQQGPKGEKSALEILQIKLKAHYFDKNTSNEDVLEKLDNPGFTDFPRLKFVLEQVFFGHANFEIPEDLKDWEPTVTFEQLNNQYGYFNQDLSALFQQLSVACKKMTSLIERQAHDDEMAYKLIALFYDPNMSIEKNFEQISKKFDKLITTKQDKTIATPYHDAFVTTLHHFPKFEDVQGLDGWKSFIIKEGFKSLDIFASCATQNPAFENIKEANTFLLAQTYPRAQENPTLAKLCKALRIKNEGFEAGLEEVKTGWPKKETDNLPIVDIQDNTGNYFWVKLPPQDMRALYLGNLIPGCCQHIGGHSEQCVKDGIERSDNGFYVLLKSKRAQGNSNRIVDNQVNDKDYDIVAQSYAWKTTKGNLCLDSIEWNQSRVTTDVIQDLMTKFSEKVFADHPDIKHINVGKGGQTPKGIYPNCLINETMKQGYLYGDARQQYQIECNIPKEALGALLTPTSSNSFFKSDSKEAIKDCINKLDSYWLSRTPKIEHTTPTNRLEHLPYYLNFNIFARGLNPSS